MQFPDYPMDHHICALKLSSCEAKHWILINHRDGFVQHWKYGWDFLQVMLLAIQKLGPLSGNLCNKLSICSDVQIHANKCWFKWTNTIPGFDVQCICRQAIIYWIKGVDSFENFNCGRIQRHVWSGRAHSGFNFFYIFHNVDTSVDCGIILNMINIVLLSMFPSLRADASPEFIV